MIKKLFRAAMILTSLTILSSSLLAQTSAEITISDISEAGKTKNIEGGCQTGNSSPIPGGSLTKLTKSDMELLLKDASPEFLKRLAENPETKRKQIESIRQLLAMAEEACKTTIWSADPEEDKKIKDELNEAMEDTRTQIIASSYDLEKNKNTGQPPFSLVSQEAVDKYYQDPANARKVEEFLKSKIAKAKKEGMIPEGEEPSEEELGQFKDQYAKINIYYKEALDNWSTLSDEFKHATELQVKMQQAQALARTYADKVLSKKFDATDVDIKTYLAAHPQADPQGAVKKYMDEHPTLTKDQESPVARIKEKIEQERQKQFLDQIVVKNPIEIAEDFEVKVPKASPGVPLKKKTGNLKK